MADSREDAVGLDLTERERAEEQLREREQQYRSIFEATSDGLLIIDPETCRVVEANPAACQIYGYAYEELLGLGPAEMGTEDRKRFEEYVRTIERGGEVHVRDMDVRKDGSPIHTEILGTRFVYRGKPHILGVVRDVTEQVRAYELLEQRVAERTRELSTLLDISHDVASTLELRPLLGLILDQLKGVVDFSGASILTLDGDAMTIVDAVARTPEDAEGALGQRFPLARGGEIWERISRREAVIIDDVRDDSPLARAYRYAVGDLLGRPPFPVVRSWLAAPLALKDRIIGMFSLSRAEPPHFTPRDATLVSAIANQAAVAIENARLYEQAGTLAALEERQRLARELHDSVSQALYGIALGARTARTLLDRDPARAAEPLDYVLELAEAGLAEMRALIFELRPESLAAEGLVAALEKQAAALRARHGLAVEAALGAEPEAPLGAKEALYRIGQEALHNAVKHARAGRVAVRLGAGPTGIVLEVADDGAGFDPGGEFPGHLGLRSMRERAASAGGTLVVDSAPGRGTRVRAWVPTTTS